METKILKETADNLQLYFQLGNLDSFERMNKLLTTHFKEVDIFPKVVDDEIKLMQKENVRIDFVHIAHRLYKKTIIPIDFKSGSLRCEQIISYMYK